MKRILTIALVCLVALFTIGCEVVTGGNYTLRSGETHSGNLTITGGDSTLEQGSRVTGSLFVTGGNVNANGQIDGDVSMTGGSVNFGPGAIVRGVLQKTGGGVHIAEGASVRSSDSFRAGTVPRWIGNLAAMLILIPLLVIVVVLALVGTRTRRGAVPQTTAAETAPASSASPAAAPGPAAPSTPGQAVVPAGRGAGLGSAIVWGVILIGLGVLFLLQELLNVDVWHYSWPFLLILPGLLCFAAMVLGGKNSGGLAIPGSILTMVGLLFLYQNTFDRFESWAYAWALIFPTSIGIGRYIEGWWSDRPELRANGIAMVRSGLVLFLILAAFFELVLNLGGFFRGDIARFAFPALLILVGVLLLLSRIVNWSGAKAPIKPATPPEAPSGSPSAEAIQQTPADR
jgi:hypothetical protein